jgi:hypothetical protein
LSNVEAEAPPQAEPRSPTCYQPEIWQVEKDVIYAAIPSVEAGLEYAKELLSAHDRDLGRTTLKNKTWAETIEADIRHMTRTLEMLRACGTNEKAMPRRPASGVESTQPANGSTL